MPRISPRSENSGDTIRSIRSARCKCVACGCVTSSNSPDCSPYDEAETFILADQATSAELLKDAREKRRAEPEPAEAAQEYEFLKPQGE